MKKQLKKSFRKAKAFVRAKSAIVDKSLVPVVALLAVAACSSSVDQHVHKGATETQLVSETKQWSFPAVTQKDLDEAVAQTVEARKNFAAAKTAFAAADSEMKAVMADGNNLPAELVAKRKATVLALYDAAVKPFEKVVLNPNYAGDAVLAKSENMKLLLRRTNEAVVAILRADQNVARELGLLTRYWKMASVGCEGGMNRCRAREYLETNGAESAAILEFYAWDVDTRLLRLKSDFEQGHVDEASYRKARADLIKLKFDAIKLTTAVRNASDDSKDRLALLWLMSGPEFTEMDARHRTSEDLEQIRVITARITLALEKRLGEESFRNHLLPYIQDKQIWTRFSLRTQADQKQIFGSVQAGAELAKVACRHYRHNSDLDKAMVASLDGKDAAGSPGFLASYKALQKSEQAVIFPNLKMTESFGASEQLFLIDQVYRGHWNRAIAEECWKARRASMTSAERKADTEEFLKLLQNYIRVELLVRVIETNQFMSTVFQPRPGEEKISSKDIFYRAIDESRQKRDTWSDLHDRVEIVKQFVESTAGVGESNNRSPEYRRFELMTKGLKNNVKILAVYPNMLVLAYYLAAKDFSVTIPTWYGGTITLDSTMITNWIFGEFSGDKDKAARPLFDFGNDSRPILTFETFYAYLFALKTNTFNTFADADAQASRARTSGEKMISEVSFFSEVVERYMNKEFVEVETDVKKLEDRYADNREYSELLLMCDADRRGQITTGDYRVDLSLENVTERTFISYGTEDRGGVFSDVYDQKSELGKLRNEFFRKYLFISTMVELLEQHWKEQLELAASPAGKSIKISVEDYADSQKKLAEIKKVFDDKLDLIRRYQGFILKHHRKLGDCLERMKNVEERQQNALLQREVNFLRVVYAAIREMHEEYANYREKAEDFAPGMSPGGNERAEFVAQLEDLYSRAVNGKLRDGEAPRGSVLESLNSHALAYFDKAGDVPTFDAITFQGGLSYSRWNMTLRARHNLQQINPRVVVATYSPTVLDTKDLYTNATKPEHRVHIRYSMAMSEYQFVKGAVSVAAAKNFQRWFTNRDMNMFEKRLGTMVELYSNESMGIIKAARDRGCQPDDERETCKSNELKPVTMGEIIEDSVRAAARMHIDENEEFLLRLVNRAHRYDEATSVRFLLDSRKRQQSILKGVYDAVAADQMLLNQAKNAIVGFNAMLAIGVDEKDALDGTVDWASAASGEMMFLAEHDIVRRLTRKNYRPLVTGTFARVKRFEATKACYEEVLAEGRDERTIEALGLPKDNKILYELDLQSHRPRAGRSVDLTKNADGVSIAGGNPVLLERRIMDDYEPVMNDFRRDTKKVFDRREGEAADSIPTNCRELRGS